ncbi:MAG: hypothetical protein M3R31_07580 [Pseudomonadota bacterium]|nr:hypothetical protein [Pseudomonadota bacterium]
MLPANLNAAVFVAALSLAAAIVPSRGAAQAAKSTECTKIGICYCVSSDLKPAIEAKVAFFRQLAAEARKAGKAVGYLSVPLSPTGGGYMKLNSEVAEAAKAAIEKRFGSDFVWVLNPGTADAELPNGSGADYMLMWTGILEGRDGLGDDFDFVYFAGPQDFARVFELDGSADMARIDQYFDKRLKSDPGLEKAVQGGLTKSAFRKYYALKASSAFSRGAHDEWNIIRLVNERRRNDSRLGIGNQLPVLFDGRGVPAADSESAVSDGYVGKCKT